MNRITHILKESGSRNIGYAKFLVSLQKLIGRVAPDAWGDKSQIDPTSVKRIHNSLRKKYGGDYAKYNALLKTQKGQFGNWWLKEGSVNEGKEYYIIQSLKTGKPKYVKDVGWKVRDNPMWVSDRNISKAYKYKTLKDARKYLESYPPHQTEFWHIYKMSSGDLGHIGLGPDLKESIHEGKWMDLWDESQEKAPSAWTKHQKWIVANAERYGFDPTKVKKLLKQHTAIHNRTYGMFASVEDWMEEKLK